MADTSMQRQIFADIQDYMTSEWERTVSAAIHVQHHWVVLSFCHMPSWCYDILETELAMCRVSTHTIHQSPNFSLPFEL